MAFRYLRTCSMVKMLCFRARDGATSAPPGCRTNTVRLGICSGGFFVPSIEHVCCSPRHQLAPLTRYGEGAVRAR
jgi:hypothetical protein